MMKPDLTAPKNSRKAYDAFAESLEMLSEAAGWTQMFFFLPALQKRVPVCRSVFVYEVFFFIFVNLYIR